MSLFQFDQNEILTFFAVLVRFSTLIAVLPFFGDKTIPVPVKILFSLATSIVIFPILVQRGEINPAEAAVWGSTASGIVGTTAIEALFGLSLGFVCRMVFQAVRMGGEVIASLMGFAAASLFDPHQETQTQVVSRFQTALAMLLFLILDGHLLMFQSALESYSIVGLGRANIGSEFANTLIVVSTEMIRLAMQLAAPMAISMFGVHMVYAILARAMPQLNVLVLSFSVSAFVGILVLYLSLPVFGAAVEDLFGSLRERMGAAMVALSQ